MKTTKLRIGMLIITTFMMTMIACSEDDGEDLAKSIGGDSNPLNNSISMDIDGTVKDFNYVIGVSANGYITLGGTDSPNSTYPSFSIILSDTASTGTYNLPSGNFAPSISYSRDQSSILVLKSGSITITAHNQSTKKVTGTFETTMLDVGNTTDVEFKNGEFNVSY